MVKDMFTLGQTIIVYRHERHAKRVKNFEKHKTVSLRVKRSGTVCVYMGVKNRICERLRSTFFTEGPF